MLVKTTIEFKFTIYVTYMYTYAQKQYYLYLYITNTHIYVSFYTASSPLHMYSNQTRIVSLECIMFTTSSVNCEKKMAQELTVVLFLGIITNGMDKYERNNI